MTLTVQQIPKVKVLNGCCQRQICVRDNAAWKRVMQANSKYFCSHTQLDFVAVVQGKDTGVPKNQGLNPVLACLLNLSPKTETDTNSDNAIA